MPRKTDAAAVLCGDVRVASMRPRPDAAENKRGSASGTGPPAASMRPRPDAAENIHERVQEVMRRYRASMRPRPDAAENRRRTTTATCSTAGFNEAAARCRGKPALNQETKAHVRTLQ